MWHDVAFGHHLWDLPRLAQPLEASADIKAAVFLGALLQGDLLPCLKGRPLVLHTWAPFQHAGC